ncbi:LysR family transcriptional regulator [Patulibacter sp. S7RM1-6]
MAPDPPIRSPDLAELRGLEAAARHGSIGAAAKELGVSQPALSKRLRQLETVVGVPLLERSPRGVVPTDAGRQLLFPARRVLEELADVDRTVLRLRGRPRSVRLAASAAVTESLLPPLLASYHRGRDQEPVELVVCSSTLVRELMASGGVDVGIAASGPGEDPDLEAFAHDELIVAVPPGHPWAERTAVPDDELVRQRLVLREPGANQRHTAEALLADRGLTLPEPRAEARSTAEALHVAREPGAPALLSRLSLPADPGMAIRPVDPALPRRFVVLAGPGRDSPGVRRLVAALRR